MNVWGDPTHHPKRQLDCCTHFHTTRPMQQSHTAWNTTAYLWRQNVTFIEPDMWPPNSPDLNRVNYAIGVVLQEHLYDGRKFENMEQLKQAIVLEWCALLQRFSDGSINQWRRRIQAVLRENGGHIEQKFN